VVAQLAVDRRCLAPTLPLGAHRHRVREGADRVERIVLASCEAFDSFPPGLTGKALALAGRLPPALFGAFMQQLRLRPLLRLRVAFGWLTPRGDAATARWLQPILEQPAIAAGPSAPLEVAVAEADARAGMHQRAIAAVAAPGLGPRPGCGWPPPACPGHG
jgi:hypothetical protein